MKILKEWSVVAPWGDIALKEIYNKNLKKKKPNGKLPVKKKNKEASNLIYRLENSFVRADDAVYGRHVLSWGDPNGEPVLLVHGRQDSAATFIPLLEHLPHGYHYVGVDMPGNGRSTPFPHGVKLSRFHFLAAVEVVIKHLQWKQFVYIGHSMGCEQGLFFNAVYPGRIKKFVFLDLGPSLQRLQVHNLVEYYNDFYREYYDNYMRDNYGFKLYSKRKVLDAVRNARGLTESQAEIILSRNLIKVGDDLYRLSWDLRLKYPAPQNFPVIYYFELFSTNAPPTLLLSATDITSRPYNKGKEAAAEIIRLLENNVPHYKIVYVEGGHDVHFTHPERLAKEVTQFLAEDFGGLPEPVIFDDSTTQTLHKLLKSKL